MRNRVEPLWPGATVVCLGAGPSLTPADVEYCRGKARIIAINSSIKLAPWADVLYACDERWWKWHRGMPGFTGLKFALQRSAARWPGVIVLHRGARDGLSLDPSALATGQNSGHQAVNLAFHLGAARILLLGYDMQRGPSGDHWHAPHPYRTPNPYGTWRRCFATLEAPLAARGIALINCSRATALEVRRQALAEALPEPEALEAAS